MLKKPPHLIGLTGGPGAGKDTVAGLLVQHHGFTTVGFSDPLRDFLYAIDEGFRMAVDTFGYTRAKAEVDGVRDRLIEVGTAARDWIHPSVWMDAVYRHIAIAKDREQSIVVTGVRYPFEADLIRDMGGTVVGVDRPGVEFENATYRDTFLNSDEFLINYSNIATLATEVADLVA